MKRTSQQNKALYKFFTLVAETLNDAGYDMKKTLKEDIEIPWTQEMVKRHMWLPLQEAMLEKEHTSDLEKTEINEVYTVLDRYMGQKLGVHVEFPHED